MYSRKKRKALIWLGVIVGACLCVILGVATAGLVCNRIRPSLRQESSSAYWYFQEKKIPIVLDISDIRATGDGIDDSAVDFINSCPEVALVDISDSRMTDLGISRMASKCNAREIWANRTKISKKGFAGLLSMRRLRRIHVSIMSPESTAIASPKVSDSPLEFVAIWGQGVDRQCIDWIAELPLLRELDIETDVSGESLESLVLSQHLELLTIGGSNINEATLAKFAEIPNLHKLVLRKSVTLPPKAVIARLIQGHPHIEIVVDRDR